MGYSTNGELIRSALFAIFAVILIMTLAYIGGSQECIAKTAEIDVDAKYGFWSGCLIRPEGEQEWLPLENYRWLAEP